MKRNKSEPIEPPEPSSRERLEWLLAFLRGESEIVLFRPGDRLNLWHDAQANLCAFEESEFDLVAFMKELHRELRAALAHLSKERHWDVSPPVVRSLVRLQVQRDGTALPLYKRLRAAEALRAAAIDLLVTWFSELRQCRQCVTWFLPRHGRQQFHDAACSARSRWSRHAPKRKRDYHAEYAQRVKRAAPGAKVTRRPRS